MEQIIENSDDNIIRTGRFTLEDFLKVAQKGDLVEFTLYENAVLDGRQQAGPQPPRYCKPGVDNEGFRNNKGPMVNADGVKTAGYVYDISSYDYRNSARFSSLGLVEKVQLTACNQEPYDEMGSWHVHMDVVKSFKVFKSYTKE